MVRGLYTAYTGMMQQQARMEVLTNNLANSTTVGFKKEGSTSRAFNQVLAIKVRDSSTSYVDQVIGKMSLGVKVGETYTDYSQGSFKATEGPLDVALSGDGFFNISYRKKGSDEDQVMYTRSGEFALTQDGTLVTKDGDYVLGQNGMIVIPPKSTVTIDSDGAIYADDQYIDTFLVTDFENRDYLAKYGENLYRAVEGATVIEANPRFVQGYLEMSNVNIVSEMVDLIDVTRAYESNQKLIQAMDETLEKSVALGVLQ